MPGAQVAPPLPDRGAALLAGDRAVRALGITVEVTGFGSATARMATSAEMGNGHGIVHGGLLFTLADTAFAYALNSHGRPGVSVHADIAFMLPARAGARVSARATERVFDGRAGIYDIEVRDDSDALLAAIRIHGRIPSARTTKPKGDG
jgi:phenylacetic acid degradation protein PaaD